jgi:hypothetical protein
MRCAKSIKLAFIALGKTGYAIELPQGVHTVTATREDFVRIGLVSYIRIPSGREAY